MRRRAWKDFQGQERSQGARARASRPLWEVELLSEGPLCALACCAQEGGSPAPPHHGSRAASSPVVGEVLPRDLGAVGSAWAPEAARPELTPGPHLSLCHPATPPSCEDEATK